MADYKVGDKVQIIRGTLLGEKGKIHRISHDFSEDWVCIYLEPRNVYWWARTSSVKLIPNHDLLTVAQKKARELLW